MNAELNRRNLPSEVLRDLVAEYGLIRVVLSLAATLAPRPAGLRTQNKTDLSDRIRRDIGLEPEPRAPDYWTL